MKSSKLYISAGIFALGVLAAGTVLAQDGNYENWDGYEQQVGQNQYQPWTGNEQQSNGNAAQLAAKIRNLVEKAEDANAADPRFLADLIALINKYPAPSNKGQVFLNDNFSDGNYTNNPAWSVSAGKWRVDTAGNQIGLTSQVRQSQGQNPNVNALLGSLLGLNTQPTAQPGLASIYTPVRFPNAFVIKVRLTSADPNGAFSIVPYQGDSDRNAYQLIYQQNNAAGLVLQRVVGGRMMQIGSYDGQIRLADGQTHELVWSRDAAGRMLVKIDGRNAIKALDTRVAGNMDGLLLANVGGNYWIHEVSIKGN
jgi:hypothetical protein